VKAGATPISQDQIIAESSSAVQQPRNIPIGTSQGLYYNLANVSHRGTRLLLTQFDVDRGFLARQEVGDEGTDDLENSAPLAFYYRFQSIPLLLRNACVEVEPPGTIASQESTWPVCHQSHLSPTHVDSVDIAALDVVEADCRAPAPVSFHRPQDTRTANIATTRAQVGSSNVPRH